MFADGVSETHPLQLDQPTDACYPSNNASQSVNNVDVTRPQKQASVTSHTTPTPRGTCLTLNDHDHIRQFIQEFTFRGLLPHIEKNIRQLNDQVHKRKPTIASNSSQVSVLIDSFFAFPGSCVFYCLCYFLDNARFWGCKMF